MDIKRKLNTIYTMEVDPHELGMLHEALEMTKKQIISGPTPTERKLDDPILLLNIFLNKTVTRLESALLKHEDPINPFITGATEQGRKDLSAILSKKQDTKPPVTVESMLDATYAYFNYVYNLETGQRKKSGKKSGKEVIMTKAVALGFAEEYLKDRENQTLSGTDNPVELPSYNVQRVWNICVEYVLNDIIPHLYGEALD